MNERKITHPDPDTQAKMRLIYSTVWGLWPNMNQMILAIGGRHGFYVQERKGNLPPAEYDLAIVQRARELEQALSVRDLAWFRAKRLEATAAKAA